MLSYKRLDQAIARVESAIAVGVLLGMVLVASLQALFFNIAERNVGWAQSVLESLSWADSFLQKGTLWLAFLGASLATFHDKHIAIDVLPRLMAPPVRRVMSIVALAGAGAVAFLLASVFYDACVVADASIPFEYELLTPQGPAHVCDVTASALGDTTRPWLLCGVRAALGAVSVPVTSGGGAAALIVPLMFLVIGVRLWGRAVMTGLGQWSPESEGGAGLEGGAEPSAPASSESKSSSESEASEASEPEAGDAAPGEDGRTTSGKSTDES